MPQQAAVRMSVARLLRGIRENGLLILPVLVALPFTVLTENCNLIKDLLLTYVVLVLLLAWVSQWLDAGKVTLAYSPLNRSILVFLGMVVVWAFLNPYRHISLLELSFFMVYVALCFLVLNSLTRLSQMRALLIVFAGVFLVVTVYGLCQYLGFDFIDWRTKGKILSSFGNPDFFAGYLVLFIPIGLAFFLSTVEVLTWLDKSPVLLTCGS